MKAYDRDLRQKIIYAYCNREGSYRKLAKRFHVSLSFVQTLLGRYLDTGSIEPLPHKGGNPAKIKDEDYPILEKMVVIAHSKKQGLLRTEKKQAHAISLSNIQLYQKVFQKP